MANDLIMNLVFPEARFLRDRGDCPFCGNHIDPEGFRDDLSLREFKISGLCQECQDKVFQV